MRGSIINTFLQPKIDSDQTQQSLVFNKKEHHSDKSFDIRLNGWTAFLLPFEIELEKLSGSRMGLVDYISHELHQNSFKIYDYKKFVVAKLELNERSAKGFPWNSNESRARRVRMLEELAALQVKPLETSEATASPSERSRSKHDADSSVVSSPIIGPLTMKAKFLPIRCCRVTTSAQFCLHASCTSKYIVREHSGNR